MNAEELEALNAIRAPVSIKDENRRARFLFYGDPGSYKTTLAAQLVENRGLLVSTDSAWVVLQGYPELTEKVERIPFEGFSQLRAICIAHTEGIEPYASFDTLILDTVSTMVQLVLRKLVAVRKYPKEQHDPEVEGWPHYRIVERALIDTIEVMNNSDLNIIYLAHVREPNDSDKEKVVKKYAIRPNMPEKSFMAVAQEVQLIGWMHRPDVKKPHQVQLQGSVAVTAKSQMATLQDSTYSVHQIPELVAKWKLQ